MRLRRLAGHDVFISYARADAAGYAMSLADQLTRDGITCFVDQWGAPPGNELPRPLMRALRGSGLMVLVGTPASTISTAVQREVTAYLRTGQPIIPISVDGALERSDWFGLIRGMTIARESSTALAAGVPSDAARRRISSAVGYWTRNRRMRRLFVTLTLAIVAVLAVGAVGLQLLRSRIATATSDLAATRQATQLERASADALRLIGSGADEREALRRALTLAESLQVLAAGRPLAEHPTVAPMLALQRISDDVRLAQQYPAATPGQIVLGLALSPDGRAVGTLVGRSGGGGYHVVLRAVPSLDTIASFTVPSGGLSSGISSLDITADGKHVIAAVGGHVEVRQLDGAPVATADSVVSVVVGALGRTLVLRGERETRVVDLAGQVLRRVGKAEWVALSRDERRVATDAMRVWPLDGGPPVALRPAPGEHHVVEGIAFDATGQMVVVWTLAGMHYVYDAATGRLRYPPWQDSTGRIGVSSVVSPTEPLVASLGHYGRDPAPIRLRALDGTLRALLRGHEERAAAVRFSPDGRYVVSFGRDDAVHFWDRTGQSVLQLRVQQDLEELAISGNSRVAATVDGYGVVRLWRLDTDPAMIADSVRAPLGLSASRSGSGFTVATASGDIIEIDSAGRTVQTTRLPLAAGAPITTAYVASNGGAVVLAAPRSARIDTANYGVPWLLRAGGPTRAPGTWRGWTKNGELRSDFAGDTIVVAVRPDGRQLVLATGMLDVRVADDDGRWTEMDSAAAWTYAVAYDPTGKLVLATGYDAVLRAWRPPFRTPELQTPTGQGEVLDVQFSPDGRTVATAGRDGTVRLWRWHDAATPFDEVSVDSLARFTAHAGRVFAVRFSPDGQRLASVGTDGLLRLWDLAGRQLAEMASHQGPTWRLVTGQEYGCRGLAFSRDGRRIAAVSDDGRVRVWPVRTLAELIKRGREQLAASGTR